MTKKILDKILQKGKIEMERERVREMEGERKSEKDGWREKE